MTAFKWDVAEYNNYRDKYSILSSSLDLYAFHLLLDSLSPIDEVLELGTYAGGSLIFFNEFLKKKQINAKFTAVDHIAWSNNFSSFPWHKHARWSLPPHSFKSFQELKTADEAAHWLRTRCKEISGEDIDLRWVSTENDLDDRKYNLIFHDYGQTKEENTATLNKCLPKLHDDGIYVIDDFEAAQPYRVIAVVEAMQQEKLFPVLWGFKKVFFAKNVKFAKLFVDTIKSNPNFENYVFDSYADYTVSGVTYNPIKLLLTPLTK